MLTIKDELIKIKDYNMFRKLKNISILIFMIEFLCSCLNAKIGTDGLYEYDYCLAQNGKKSTIISLIESFSYENKRIISGRVIDLKSRKQVSGAIVNLETEVKTNMIKQITDSLGRFSFTVEPNKYQVKAQCIGYTDFETKIIANKNSYLEIGLGEAGGFVTYGIKSKRKLTKFQLRQKAVKLSKRN